VTSKKSHPRVAEFFPFPEIRPAQEEALAVIEKAHAAHKKFVVLEIPTGGGKSGIAIAAAQWAKAVFGGGSYILSPQKTLTSQYLDDFAKIGLRELRGRNSYQCAEFGTDCERGGALRGANKDACQRCPYRLAKQDFISSALGVTNFSYYISEMGSAGELGRRSMLILDEGHNTEMALLGETDIEIKPRQQIQYGIQSIPQKSTSVAEYRRWAEKMVCPVVDNYIQGEEKLEHSNNEEKIASFQRVSSARKMLLRLARFIKSDALDQWIAWTDDKNVITIRPLTPRLYAGRMLFDHADMIIVMSATILDIKTFTRNLGIDEKTCEFLALPSDFPKENRQIQYRPIGSMVSALQDKTLPALASFIRDVISQSHANEKGMVHTHTRRINEYLVNALKDLGSRIITYNNPKDRDRAVNAHRTSPQPTVLFSPGMAEGLDLKDDLSRFQIICKVPYPYLDQYTRSRMKLDPAWYRWRTALTLVQATGRSVRSKNDYAITYVADSQFERFITENMNCLPVWWMDAIRWPKSNSFTMKTSDPKGKAGSPDPLF
jgi:ATP-dependent DNA helicase DinG